MPRNTQRVFLAREQDAAPRNRLDPQLVEIDANSAVDITALLPTQADLGDSPAFDMLVGFNRNVVNTGLLGVRVTDDQAVAGVTHPLIGDEEVDGIRVRGIFPLQNAGDTAINTPLRTAAGAVVQNWVYLVNEEPEGDAISVWIVFEIPDNDYE